MDYIKIDFDCGLSIKDAVKLLHSKTEATGKKYFGEFNGHKLTSDMTVDEACEAMTDDINAIIEY